MQVSTAGREFAIARTRSVVKVAMPQRRGNELPITAMRRRGVMLESWRGLQSWRGLEAWRGLAPRCRLRMRKGTEPLNWQDWRSAHRAVATANRSGGLPDMRSAPSTRLRQPQCWYG